MALDHYYKAAQETTEGLRIIDDSLWRLVAAKPGVCQEILRTILDMPKLKVVKVEVQEKIQSLHREITIDALCTAEDGSLHNIEMQKGNRNDDIRRTRYHAAAITAKYTPKGTEFKDVPNITIVYITEYDALNNNKTVTHVSRCMEIGDNDYIPINDGEDIIFANTAVIDNTDRSELLQLMLEKNVFYNSKFPATSSAIRYYKGAEGGRRKLCETVENYARNVAKEVSIDSIKTLIQKGTSLDVIVEAFPLVPRDDIQAIFDELSSKR